MKRAVVVFIENKRDLLLQFGCLYSSLKYINCPNTDLVVFGPEDVLKKLPNDCRKVVYDTLVNPKELLHYPYINSISCLTGKEGDILCEYDFILRTDADTFLTPAWNQMFPRQYTVGRGAYAYDQTVKAKIKEVSRKFGLTHQSIHNIGSTHYGETSKVREVCQKAYEITCYLLTEEFKGNSGKWPGWFVGVSTMYASEIAVNHYVQNVKIDSDQFDYGSTSSDSTLNHAHIHCWHTDKDFSKFHFTAGRYDHLDKSTLNTDIIKDYCMYIAIKSKELKLI